MSESIGEILKQARLDRKISIKSASEATAIRGKYLEALESDDLDSLPSPVQARGFLRIYAKYLGLNPEPLIAEMRGVPAPVENSSQAEKMETQSENPIYDEIPELQESNEIENIDIPSDDLENEPVREQAQPPSLPLPLSQSIYVEIGLQLKARRELLSLNLDEIERHTHIRKHHLVALEAGAIDDMPTPVQARGTLSSYSRFLDLDSESLLLRFAEGLQASQQERHPRKLRSRSMEGAESLPSSLRWLFSTDMIVGGGMILAMLAFAIWGANRIISQKEQAQGVINSTQSISEALIATSEVTLESTELSIPTFDLETPGFVVETSTPDLIPPINNNSPVQVIAAITGNTWLRVVVDGKVEFQGRATAGSALSYNGEESVGIITANGSSVQIVYNGEDLGPMGEEGQIVEIIYTPQGILLPTPTNTPTPTRTPRTTPTYTPSITPTPGGEITE